MLPRCCPAARNLLIRSALHVRNSSRPSPRHSFRQYQLTLARIWRRAWLDAAHSTVWLRHGSHDHRRTYIDIILERGRFEMMERIAEMWPSPRARITGVVYLLYFLTAVGDDVFVGRGRLVVYDAVNLIAHVFYIAVTLLFYYMV